MNSADEESISALPAANAPAGRLTGGWKRSFPMFSPAQLFALVSDIESYPQFVPGCVKTRILAKGDNHWRVDNVFRFGPIRSRFITLADFHPPGRVEIASSDGPWTSFLLVWGFEPAGAGCLVSCRYAVNFRSRLLATLASFGLAKAERQVAAAFEKRAWALYGSARGEGVELP